MFYLCTSADHSRLNRAVEGRCIVLAAESTLVGWGPDCYYLYSQLVWGEEPVDPGKNPLVDAAFGVGPEPRAVTVRPVSLAEARGLVRRRGRKCTVAADRLPFSGLEGLETYRTWNGSIAVWSTEALVDTLEKGELKMTRYQVREPGCTSYAEAETLHEAVAEVVAARRIGLARAGIHDTTTGEWLTVSPALAGWQDIPNAIRVGEAQYEVSHAKT